MNYTELRRAIISDLASDDASLLGQIDNFITEAESLIWTAVRMPAFTAAQTLQMQAGDSTSLAPIDFLSADYIVIPGKSPMRKKDSSFVREAFGASMGEPKYFALEDNVTLLWGPTPDQAYEFQLNYFCRPESIVSPPTTSGPNFDPRNKETYTSITFPSALLHGSLMFGYGFQRDWTARSASMDAFEKTLSLASGFVKSRVDRQDFEKASASVVTE